MLPYGPRGTTVPKVKRYKCPFCRGRPIDFKVDGIVEQYDTFLFLCYLLKTTNNIFLLRFYKRAEISMAPAQKKCSQLT